MTAQTPDRLKIFLALALERGAEQKISASDFMPSLDAESEFAAENIEDDPAEMPLSPLYECLSAPENEKLRLMLAEYQNKTDDEQFAWRAVVKRGIGNDQTLIDETIHWSHVSEALRREIPAIQKIITAILSPNHQNQTDFTFAEKVFAAQTSNGAADTEEILNKSATPLEKTVRRAFAKQFVALRDLQAATAFDRLTGAQLARLIRLAGIREVALACVRIEAVESVAAFLRRFSAEDARAIAAQINNLRATPAERLDSAENLVQTVIEVEPETPAMLDLIGIRLLGIALCRSDAWRIQYTNQKLPLEAAQQLPEIIAEQCRQTLNTWQSEIEGEIEHLAATIIRAGGRKSVKRKTGRLTKI